MALLTELKARGLSVTTSEAAELHHRVEPTLHGSAHSQVASAFGGVEPPTLPAGPSPLAAEPVVETGGSPQRGLQRLHASLPVLQCTRGGRPRRVRQACGAGVFVFGPL